MLMACPACKQVVEISGLTDHLLSECDHRGEYVLCSVCKDAVRGSDMGDHTPGVRCCPVGTEAVTCPLCRREVGEGPHAWRVHLVDTGCDANPRKARG